MVTIKDVAKKAGVSAGTVSLVLNESPSAVPIGQATKEKVLRTVKELDYHPNPFARSLRRGKSSTFGLITFDARDPYFIEIMRGAEEIIHSRNYNFILSDAANDKQKLENSLRVFAQGLVDGVLIIANSFVMANSIITSFARKAIPIIVIGKRIEDERTSCILIDNVKGSYLAVEYLIKLGHKKIGFILGPSWLIDSQQRLDGIKSALSNYGLKYDEELVEQEEGINSSAYSTSGYQAMNNLLKKDGTITAVFAFDDMASFGAIRVIEEKGLRVPDDISIIGFDDIPISAYYNPPLTTIRQPMLEMGKKGAELLFELVENGKKSICAENVIMQPELVVRKSSKSVREA